MVNVRCAGSVLSGLLVVLGGGGVSAQGHDLFGEPAAGYGGIWYSNQASADAYRFKYSGGLGTYCAKHAPFAVHRPEVGRTYFCYGGAPQDGERRLLHMVSYFDHATGEVPRPTLLLDKQTGDAHDNPVLAVDDDGFVWIFSTSHGRSRPSYVHRSHEPHDISAFDRLRPEYEGEDGEMRPFDNFSYMQAWHVPGEGFVCFFTRYGDPVARTSMFMTSADGVRWSRRQRLAAIEQGHYQISAVGAGKAACAFNYHPDGKGLNWRANLYYLETTDGGKTWIDVRGEEVAVPVTKAANPALVHDSRAADELVYLKDIRLDGNGRPAILFLTSKGYQAGPGNDPRTWRLARWTGEEWRFSTITTSDNNYDMGSLFGGEDGHWQLIAPTASGPQRYNPGGEIALWQSEDDGVTWQQVRLMTEGSPRNHTYVRRPVNGHPGFFGFWADGHARQVSESRLYFCNAAGDVFMLPAAMDGERARPLRVGGD